jgi:hypothetical protein
VDKLAGQLRKGGLTQEGKYGELRELTLLFFLIGCCLGLFSVAATKYLRLGHL